MFIAITSHSSIIMHSSYPSQRIIALHVACHIVRITELVHRNREYYRLTAKLVQLFKYYSYYRSRKH